MVERYCDESISTNKGCSFFKRRTRSFASVMPPSICKRSSACSPHTLLCPASNRHTGSPLCHERSARSSPPLLCTVPLLCTHRVRFTAWHVRAHPQNLRRE